MSKIEDSIWFTDKMQLCREDRWGNKFWYNDKRQLHREDGPSIEWGTGDKSWCYNGNVIGESWNRFTQEKFDKYIRSLKIKEYW